MKIEILKRLNLDIRTQRNNKRKWINKWGVTVGIADQRWPSKMRPGMLVVGSGKQWAGHWWCWGPYSWPSCPMVENGGTGWWTWAIRYMSLSKVMHEWSTKSFYWTCSWLVDTSHILPSSNNFLWVWTVEPPWPPIDFWTALSGSDLRCFPNESTDRPLFFRFPFSCFGVRLLSIRFQFWFWFSSKIFGGLEEGLDDLADEALVVSPARRGWFRVFFWETIFRIYELGHLVHVRA